MATPSNGDLILIENNDHKLTMYFWASVVAVIAGHPAKVLPVGSQMNYTYGSVRTGQFVPVRTERYRLVRRAGNWHATMRMSQVFQSIDTAMEALPDAQ